MTPRTRHGGFQRQSRKTTDWGLGPANTGTLLTASGKTLWNVGTSPSQNFTVIRTRGNVSVYQFEGIAALDGFAGAHGIYMMTEDAFAVGVTAALGPQGDANSDMWLWHSFFDVQTISTSETDGVNAVAVVSRITIDSKAMRKDFDPERVMVGVTEVTETGGAQAKLTAQTRQLFKS